MLDYVIYSDVEVTRRGRMAVVMDIDQQQRFADPSLHACLAWLYDLGVRTCLIAGQDFITRIRIEDWLPMPDELKADGATPRAVHSYVRAARSGR